MPWTNWVDEKEDAGTYLVLSKSGTPKGRILEAGKKLLLTPGDLHTQVFLSELHRRNFHISCACKNDQVSHVCHNHDSNLYYWRVNKSSPQHDSECPLAQESKRMGLAALKPLAIFPNTDAPLNLFVRPKGADIASPKTSGVRRQSRRKLNKLSQMLVKVILDCQWNIYTNKKRNSYKDAIEAMEDVELVEGVSVKDLFTCHYRFIESKLKRLMNIDTWPEDQERYLIALLLIHEVNATEKELKVKVKVLDPEKEGKTKTVETSIRIDGRMTNIAGGYGGESGPYVGLVAYKEIEGVVKPYQAAYCPIVSLSNWVPVDSNNERRVFFHLKAQIEDVYEASGKDIDSIVIEKPLVSVLTDDQPSLVPDYVIRSEMTGRAVSIEVNGFGDEEYLDHKKDQLVRARELYGQGMALDMTSNAADAVKRRISQLRWMAYWLAELSNQDS